MAKKIKKHIFKTAKAKSVLNRKKLAVKSSVARDAVKKKEHGGVKDTKIKVIGIGGGGGSIVNGLAGKLSRASFYALNTDLQALEKLGSKIKRIAFGQELTRGLGTGRNSELGQAAAVSDRDKWEKAFTGPNQSDLYIIVSSLGGGVGSGATPVVAKTLKNTVAIVYGIFTLPFSFEGGRKMEAARLAIEKTRPYLNAYTVISNEAIFNIVGRDTPLNQALQAVNDGLGQSLTGLMETIYEPGLINIDFADLKAVFDGRGRLAYLNTVCVEGTDRGTKAVEGILSSLLYSYGARGAKGVIYNINGRGLTLEEINLISKTIGESANKDAKIIFGVSHNHILDSRTTVTVLATGCGTKIFPSKNDNIFKKAPVNDNLKKAKKPVRKKQSVKKNNINGRKKKNKIKNMAKKGPKNNNKNDGGINAKETGQSTASGGREKEEGEERANLPLDNNPIAAPVIIKIRRNANQIKQATEDMEEEMLKEEKKWEIPAFMRKTLNDNHPQTS